MKGVGTALVLGRRLWGRALPVDPPDEPTAKRVLLSGAGAGAALVALSALSAAASAARRREG